MFDAAADAEWRSAPRVRSRAPAAAGPARTEQVVLLAHLNPRDLRTRSLLDVIDRAGRAAGAGLHVAPRGDRRDLRLGQARGGPTAGRPVDSAGATPAPGAGHRLV